MNHLIRLIGKALPTSQFGEPYLWFESLTGHEAMNQLFEYQLIVKTKHSDGTPALYPVEYRLTNHYPVLDYQTLLTKNI